MKNFAMKALTVAALALPMGAFASDTGCGVGTQIFQGQTGLLPHTAAATTNGTFGNQTFGMTFDSLGCDTTKSVKNEQDPKAYASANQDVLAADVARGGGEHLAALGAALGVTTQDRAAFYDVAQANYEAVVSGNMVDTLRVAMAADASLAKYVR